MSKRGIIDTVKPVGEDGEANAARIEQAVRDADQALEHVGEVFTKYDVKPEHSVLLEEVHERFRKLQDSVLSGRKPELEEDEKDDRKALKQGIPAGPQGFSITIRS